MKTIQLKASAIALFTCLILASPAFSQTEKGYDGDQSVKSGQRDNEDRETNLDWIGLFGLFGLTGLIGSRQPNHQTTGTIRKTLIATTVIATAALLTMAEPAVSRALQDSDGDNSSVASDNDDGHTNFGWVGLLGLAGLLGLRKRRSDDNTLTRPGTR